MIIIVLEYAKDNDSIFEGLNLITLIYLRRYGLAKSNTYAQLG